MSHRRCRYCGEVGHNRITCLKFKEYTKNNPNSLAARRESERLDAAKHRKCSYCFNEGHNRKTCSLVLEDKIKVAGMNQDFRKNFLENIIKKNGIAPGALVNLPETSGYTSDGVYRHHLNRMALVIELLLDEVKFPNKERACQVVKIQYMDLYEYGGKRLAETFLAVPNWFILGKEKPDSNWWRNKLNFSVVSPGHYNMENEEEWVRSKEAVESICKEYENHEELKFAF